MCGVGSIASAAETYIDAQAKLIELRETRGSSHRLDREQRLHGRKADAMRQGEASHRLSDSHPSPTLAAPRASTQWQMDYTEDARHADRSDTRRYASRGYLSLEKRLQQRATLRSYGEPHRRHLPTMTPILSLLPHPCPHVFRRCRPIRSLSGPRSSTAITCAPARTNAECNLRPNRSAVPRRPPTSLRSPSALAP